MRLPLLLSLAATAPAFGQIASDDFEVGNPNNWGVEFILPGTHMATGGRTIA